MFEESGDYPGQTTQDILRMILVGGHVTQEEFNETAPVLQELVDSPGWKILKGLVHNAVAIVHQQALYGEEAELKFHRGSVEGMVAVLRTPIEFIAQARQKQKEAEEQGGQVTLAPRPSMEGSTL